MQAPGGSRTFVCVCAGGRAWCVLFTAWSHQLTNARRCAAISASKKHLHLIASGGFAAPRLNPARRHARLSTKSEVQARNSVTVLPVSFHYILGHGAGGRWGGREGGAASVATRMVRNDEPLTPEICRRRSPPLTL